MTAAITGSLPKRKEERGTGKVKTVAFSSRHKVTYL